MKTEQTRPESSKAPPSSLAASVLQHRLKGIMVCDLQGHILLVNEAFSQITGYSEAEIRGKHPDFLYSGRQGKDFCEQIWKELDKEQSWQGEIWNRRKNGSVYPEWLSISRVENAEGSEDHYVAIFSDITERKLSEERLYYLAHHDILTELPNERLLSDRLAQALKQAERSSQKLAVFSIDLDHFNLVNEGLGQETGDAMLIDAATCLKKCVRDCDTVARISEDHFIILLTESSEIEHTATIAQKILHRLAKPIPVGKDTVIMRASIGIALFPADGRDSQSLLKSAEVAMKRVKTQGRNGYQFYSQEVEKYALERIALKIALQRALEEDQFEVYYQPKLNLKTGRISSLEALVRWHHPQKGLILPDTFIPMAEETNLILPIGEWVLRTACEQTQAWRQAGFSDLRIAVNFSPRQFHQEKLVERVLAVLEETGLPPEALELEITESVAISHIDQGIETMRLLGDKGIRLSIDDFGIGYSSLGYIRQFPVQCLKVDQSFIHNLTTNPENAAITAAIISMAHNLNLEVIAEGTETQAELDFLQKHNCDAMQGFSLSRPLPANKVADFIENGDYQHLVSTK